MSMRVRLTRSIALLLTLAFSAATFPAWAAGASPSRPSPGRLNGPSARHLHMPPLAKVAQALGRASRATATSPSMPATGGSATAVTPSQPSPAYGPLAVTGTGGLPSGQSPAGTSTTGTPATPATPNGLGQPLPATPPFTEQSGGRSRLDSRFGAGGSTLAGCMALWEKATHMTRAEWQRTCKKTLNATELPSPASKPVQQARRKHPDAF